MLPRHRKRRAELAHSLPSEEPASSLRRTWSLSYRVFIGCPPARPRDRRSGQARRRSCRSERKRAVIAAAARSDTVANVAEEFIRRSLEGEGRDRAASYISAIRRMFDEHMLPRWRARDIRSITRRDVVALLDNIVDDGKPVLANRVLAAVRAMFNWAIRRGIVDASPATLVERPAEEKARERTLCAEEIAVLWPLFAGLGYPFGPFFQAALATGQRRDEVARMRWADIDATERTWTLSGAQTKARRAHVVPLSPLAWDILSTARGAARALNDVSATKQKESAYVFTTTGDTPISGFGKAKLRVDVAAARRCAGRVGSIHAAPWTIHPPRRTAASSLARSERRLASLFAASLTMLISECDRDIRSPCLSGRETKGPRKLGHISGQLHQAPEAHTVPQFRTGTRRAAPPANMEIEARGELIRPAEISSRCAGLLPHFPAKRPAYHFTEHSIFGVHKLAKQVTCRQQRLACICLLFEMEFRAEKDHTAAGKKGAYQRAIKGDRRRRRAVECIQWRAFPLDSILGEVLKKLPAECPLALLWKNRKEDRVLDSRAA